MLRDAIKQLCFHVASDSIFEYECQGAQHEFSHEDQYDQTEVLLVAE